MDLTWQKIEKKYYLKVMTVWVDPVPAEAPCDDHH